jgi:hypothetical protein
VGEVRSSYKYWEKESQGKSPFQRLKADEKIILKDVFQV